MEAELRDVVEEVNEFNDLLTMRGSFLTFSHRRTH